MYNTQSKPTIAQAAAQCCDVQQAKRIPEIPDALETLKIEVDRLNDELNSLSARLSPVMRPEPAATSDCEKIPNEPYGLLEPILRIRRSIGCASSQVRQITSTLMI